MKIFSLTFLIFGFATALLSAQTVIDNFNNFDDIGTGEDFFGANATTNTRTVLAPEILGGQRDDSITAITMGQLASFNGFITVAQVPDANNVVSASLVYDNFSDLDLTSGGQSSGFSLEFTGPDVGPALADVLTISVTSGAVSAESSVTVPASTAVGISLGVVTVDFTNFAGVDFTSVDSVSLNFDFASAPGRDVGINNFATVAAVPEPSGLGLGCLVVGGFFLRRGRNN